MSSRFAMWRYAAGAAAARTGDDMSGPALLLAGYAATGSAAVASALLAGITVAAAVGGPVFGALLDRSARPGRLLAGTLAGYAAGLTVILASLGHVPVVLTVLVAVGVGLLGPALAGGWTSQVPLVVAPADLPRANAVDAMTFNVAGLVGPALAGAVAGLLGAPAGVVTAIVLICLALPVAWTLPARTPPQRPSSASPASSPSLAADLAAGFRALFRSRPLARATTASVVSCLGEGMLIACVPLLGERAFGSAHHGVLLLTLVAAAALTANAVLARRPDLLRPDTVVWCSTLVLAVALLLAATVQPVLLVAAALLVGVGEGPQLTALFAVRHREAPHRLRGQIFTTGASFKITGYALGAGLAGLVAGWSLSGALLLAAGFQALACGTFWAFRTSSAGRASQDRGTGADPGPRTAPGSQPDRDTPVGRPRPPEAADRGPGPTPPAPPAAPSP